MAEHNDFGALAEQRVKAYLERKGYQMLHTNWRCGHKELDVVALDGDMLVVIEVKARKTKAFGLPFEAVNNTKIKRIVSAANAYVKRYSIDRDVRFDVVSVVLQKDGSLEVDHIVDAFLSPIY